MLVIDLKKFPKGMVITLSVPVDDLPTVCIRMAGETICLSLIESWA